MRAHEHAHAHTNAYTRAHAHGHTRTHVRAHTYTHEYLYSTYGSRCLYRYSREDPYLQVLMRICTHFSICLKLALSLSLHLSFTLLYLISVIFPPVYVSLHLSLLPPFSPFLPSLFSLLFFPRSRARGSLFVCVYVFVCVLASLSSFLSHCWYS